MFDVFGGWGVVVESLCLRFLRFDFIKKARHPTDTLSALLVVNHLVPFGRGLEDCWCQLEPCCRFGATFGVSVVQKSKALKVSVACLVFLMTLRSVPL